MTEELIVVEVHGVWVSRRVAKEADNIYGPAGKTVAKQDYVEPEWDGENWGEVSEVAREDAVYLRPRPPSMNKQSNLRYVIKRMGKLELGFRFQSAGARAKTGIPGRFELWSRDSNTGALKMLGDCLPVEMKDEAGFESQWQLWQKMLTGTVFFQTVEEARKELTRRHGRTFRPMNAEKALPPPSPPVKDVQRLEGPKLALPPAPYGRKK